MMQLIRSIIAIPIAIAFTLCLAGCMAEDQSATPNNTPSSAAESFSDTAEETAEAEVEEEPVNLTQESAMFRLTPPAEIAKYIEWDSTQDNRLVAYYGDIELFEVACYDTDDGEPQWKSRMYSCGFGGDESGWHEVTVAFPYLTADGTANATKNDKNAKVLALKYLLGAEEEDIYSTVEIQVASGEQAANPRWNACYPVLLTDDADADDLPSKSSKAKSSSSGAVNDEDPEDKAQGDGKAEPFWGVWIGSFQDRANAGTFASEAQAAGWSGASVYTSTDWSDLNSKRWYVVSLGEFGSESDADAALKKARKSQYKDAYVKYTGDFIG